MTLKIKKHNRPHKTLSILICGACLSFSTLALADDHTLSPVQYISDPVYESIDGSDDHPLDVLMELATEEDSRAQFILGDLYGKGRGGVPQNTEAAKLLFEHSAKGGTPEAFIRLAAIARRENDNIEAYKWYSLAIERMPRGESRTWATNTRNALDLSGAERRRGNAAAREWSLTRLEPLRLYHPFTPLTPPENISENRTSAQDTSETPAKRPAIRPENITVSEETEETKEED